MEAYKRVSRVFNLKQWLSEKPERKKSKTKQGNQNPYLTVSLGKGGKWQIAAMYGVSRTAIYDICNRRSWKHVRRIHPCEKDEVVE